jgi:predicted ATP-dependent endonuclease of OLD family
MSVRNFRALEEMDVDFHPMTVIIGENDVGKTSCMLAMQTLFERSRLDERSDFFKCDVSRSVTIEARFEGRRADGSDPTDGSAENSALRLRCAYKHGAQRDVQLYQPIPKNPKFRYIEKQKVGELRATLSSVGEITSDDQPSKPEAQKLLKSFVVKLPAEEFEDAWADIKERDLARLLPDFVFVPVSRDLESSLRMTDTSLLGRLFRPLFKQAVSEGQLEENLGVLRSRLQDSVAARVQDLECRLQEQLNNQTVALTHAVDLDPMRGLTFDFGMDDERVQGIPIEKRGAGVHNNLALAMFRLLAEYGAKDFVLAIEEPENSLHPRGQREMLWALQALSSSAQVICTTHSSVFVDLGRLEDNIVLTRTSKGNTIPRSFKTDDISELRELLGIRVSDALLSGGGNCALIVEGATELHAYPHLFRLAGYDARALGVSIVPAEGSDYQKIRRILLVLKLYDIPAVVVLDRDAEKTARDLQGYGPGGELPNLRKVFLLEEGSFEAYIPLEIAVDVINARLPGETITCDEIDPEKNREKEFRRLIYEKKGPGARFEHLKVEFGELFGKEMVKRGVEVPPELNGVLDEVKRIAEEV